MCLGAWRVRRADAALRDAPRVRKRSVPQRKLVDVCFNRNWAHVQPGVTPRLLLLLLPVMAVALMVVATGAAAAADPAAGADAAGAGRHVASRAARAAARAAAPAAAATVVMKLVMVMVAGDAVALAVLLLLLLLLMQLEVLLVVAPEARSVGVVVHLRRHHRPSAGVLIVSVVNVSTTVSKRDSASGLSFSFAPSLFLRFCSSTVGFLSPPPACRSSDTIPKCCLNLLRSFFSFP